MIDDVIATRVLHCQLHGTEVEVTVRLGRPYPEQTYFVCDYEISSPIGTEAYSLAAKDSFQVLQLAPMIIGSVLGSVGGPLKEATNWLWDGSPNIGFPITLDQLRTKAW